ncbi:hypothetical protein FJ364_00800 [Candidatus Dependentiae bacterium]|nr:hypothetical protein [Candidatus Dependentiae bacterium]
MKFMIKSLMAAALAMSAAHVNAHTNQGFLSVPRAQRASLVLDSAIAHQLVKTNKEDRFGGNLLVRGFYSESNKKDALGKYFGVNDQATFKAAWGTHNNAAAGDQASGVNAGFLVHDATATIGAQALAPADFATIAFQPKTVSYGLEFGYEQCLGKILEGLHLSIALPVERVENNMNLDISTPGAHAADVTTLQDFFAGKLGTGASVAGVVAGAGANLSGQNKLSKALIDGKRSATGIADIDAILGYDFVRNENWTAGLNIGLVVPLGNQTTGQYLFEPVYGNGGHWELGFGGRVQGTLWQDGDQHIALNLQADYRYGFKANETRTLSISKDGIQNNLNQYYLTVTDGAIRATEAPFANANTVAVSVTPNSAVRGNLGLCYGNGGFVFGVAYAPSWKQAESVSVTPNIPANTIVLHPEQDSMDRASVVANGVAFTSADVNADYSKRPEQLAHRFGGDLGYTFKEWEYPITIGAGAHYELGKDNATVENWGVNVTAGIGF